MAAAQTLTMVDGVRVVVPDALDLITPYVLIEQQDWFEDEIKFLRRLLRPGDNVIDIGANYGVYTLSMARTVGPTGAVWAFEPASTTARFLADGIAANGFAHVVLSQSALSNRNGTAQLALNTNAELNALIHDAAPAGATESVPLVTLDHCLERFGWRDIALMKLDAEGEEGNIVRGGERFFAELSPLVQYEIKVANDLHLDLVHQFAALGYRSYRLVPGLDLLVPFDAQAPADGYLLNLFCCKADRAAQLAARGHLQDGAAAVSSDSCWEEISDRTVYHWRQALTRFAYGRQLAGVWEQELAPAQATDVDEALSLHALSRDESIPTGTRFAALEASLHQLKSLCDREPKHFRLASLARTAQEYGARSLATSALNALSNGILQSQQIHLGEPFLAPSERFDSVPPAEAPGNWALGAVLEELERSAAFSSFYSGASSHQRLKVIQALGFGSDEMRRRLNLLHRRFGLPP